MSEAVEARVDIRENPVLQLGSMVLAVLSLIAAVVPAVGLTLAVVSLTWGALIPPQRRGLRIATLVLVLAALAVNVVALLLAISPVAASPGMVVKPD